MDQVILRVLAAEVQRRRCPGCNKPLRQADISAHFSGVDKVQLHFRCRFCVFEGGGEIELTAEIYEEAARNSTVETREESWAEPISADEMLHVHELLEGWKGSFSDLLSPRPERQPK
ncbi:MAG TPA: hypothetical protein VF160_11735 [Candidatus Dormibacteraeota bacterium]